ncbi:expressed unknown protein [Seminavis robusta]|uniref:Uncharacterized protein n=1 Tax=Seminavis robusta TaxID=568900 RepID=A0A9N8DIJ1_9STRA|nr:expressed unknown protein [Seminavis robusta]|eukprot:Sro161_g072540.1 n/a (202) ;mRNA; f:62149-62754
MMSGHAVHAPQALAEQLTDDSSVLYEPLSLDTEATFHQNKENNVNHRHFEATRGPLSTRHDADGTRGRRLVDGMVKVATACNLLVRRHACNLCHVYADRQVEFEQREESSPPSSSRTYASSSSPTERAWKKMNSSLEVDLYRRFLFDEESVANMEIIPEGSGEKNESFPESGETPQSVTEAKFVEAAPQQQQSTEKKALLV